MTIPAAPSSLYESERRQVALTDAWRTAESLLPTGWSIVEVSKLYGPEKYREQWYASATDARRSDGEWIEGEGDSPVRALLALARAAFARRHRIGRPARERLPSPLPARAGRESPFRSHDMGRPAQLGS